MIGERAFFDLKRQVSTNLNAPCRRVNVTAPGSSRDHAKNPSPVDFP